MFAGELRKQKVLFAIADLTAVELAFAAALILHDPSGAMEVHLKGADPQTLAECVVIAAILWVGVFRALISTACETAAARKRSQSSRRARSQRA
jgi:hypothetical protein